MENNQLLKVYSASAGSGKTYTLARYVMDLLIENPQNYRNILAVTFTNKATAEMRERIIKDLGLVSGLLTPSSEKERKDTEDIIKRQMEMRTAANQPITEEKVKQRCADALRRILCDYSHFTISTIDSFVQSVIRAFAYEQNLPSNYGVEIDNEEMLNSAVDHVMESLSSNKLLCEWVVNYAKELLRNKVKTSKIEESIRALGKTILTDKWSNISKSAPKDIEEVGKLKKLVDEEKREICKTICEALGSLYANVNRDNLQKARGVGKLVEQYAQDFAIAQHSEWHRIAWTQNILDKIKNLDATFYLKKSCTEADRIQVSAFINTLTAARPRFFTCESILQSIVALGVMMELDKQISDVQKDGNKISIGSTGDLLKKLIDDSSIPFIYEKIGSRYDYMMMDEFQDTSRVQYDNFTPLLHNSLDNGNRCLVVGDVKQSIYRFRDGDWKMLHEDLQNDFSQNFYSDNLKDNYRSLRNIVEFNNKLYDAESGLPKVMSVTTTDAETITKIYENSKQNVKSKDEKGTGIVDIRIFMTDACKGSELIKASRQQIKKEYVGEVRRLHDEMGFQYKDICFLVRDKRVGSSVVNTLADEGLPVMSEDSLFVLSVPSTRAIVNLMRHIAYTDPVAIFAAASVIYQEKGVSYLMNNWQNGERILEKMDSELAQLRGLGLPELFGKLQDMLPINRQKTDHPFIVALGDYMRQAVQDGHVLLTDFVDLAKRNESNWSIEAPKSKDAIRVMTIHKSKGLEFRAVLIPSFDWDLTKDDKIWCDMQDSEVNYASQYTLPLTADKTLQQSDISNYYNEEMLMQMVDNLNTAYVATTRPTQVLRIWGINAVAQNSSKSIGSLAQYLHDALSKELVTETIEFDEKIQLTVKKYELNGTIVPEKTESPKPEQSDEREHLQLEEWEPIPHQLVIEAVPIEEASLAEKTQKQESVKKGVCMHRILEKTITTGDIDAAVAAEVATGEMDAETAEDARLTLHERLTSPATKKWFDGSMTKVWTEIGLLDYKTKMIVRPDRVMLTPENGIVILDYKFGTSKKEQYAEKHRQQVTNYSNIVKSIWPDKEVSAYLWYYTADKLEKVL